MNSGLTMERIIRYLIYGGIVVAVVWFVWYFKDLLIYLAISMILAYVLKPAVDTLQGLGMERLVAVLITFLLVFVALSFLVAMIAPFLARQAAELTNLISLEAVQRVAISIEDFLSRFMPIEPGTVIAASQRAFEALFQQERLTGAMTSIVGMFTNIFYALIIIPFTTFFLLKDSSQFHHTFLRMVPNRYFELTIAIFEKIESNLGRYFRGLLFQMLSVGVVAAVLLWLAGLRGAVFVGIFAGLANTIPYFGPLMGFLAGAIMGIAQTGDFSLIPGIFFAMVITQVADNIILQPLIFSRAAQAHPLVILFVVLIGAELGGILGMLLAIPVATILRVTVQQVIWSLRNYRIFRMAT